MAFQKMRRPAYPPRLWVLVGYPGSGKSTFAAQMRAPLLVVDADHRFAEVVDLAQGDVFGLSEAPADNVDADRIAAILAADMPGSGVRTIVVDSLTAIITPLVVAAMRDKDAGRAKNLFAAWRDKALAARQLQDAVTRWGCDVLWVYHLQDARDAQGQELTRATLSETERARLTRSINLQLELVTDQDGRRGVKVVWARRGRSGLTLWDDTGSWVGMPDAIETAVYDGLTEADQDRLEEETPAAFPNPETAIAWGLEQGAFQALQHSRNAYNKLKKEKRPKDAQEMAALWVADVQARLEASEEEGAAVDAEAVQEELPLEEAQVSPEGEEEGELDRFFPREGGDGDKAQGVATSPAALLASLQEEFGGYFQTVKALHGALQAELGAEWTWPAAADLEGWAKAQARARAFVRKNS
jgi:hypothetical protein